MKFKTTVISNKGQKSAKRPCTVIRVSDNKVLENFESRKACAIALGLDSPTISLVLHGYTARDFKIVDAKHGELKVVDGIVEKPKPKRPSRAKPKASSDEAPNIIVPVVKKFAAWPYPTVDGLVQP